LSEKNSFGSVKGAIVGIILLGAFTLILSVFFISSFFAIVGFSLIFWGAILLYVIPTKSNLALLVSAAAQPGSANIEGILSQKGLVQKGVYMSTDFIITNSGIFKKLTDLEKTESTLVFVPMESHASKDTSYSEGVSIKAGIYFIPPGDALCAFFEKQMGKSFSRISLKEFGATIENVLIKRLKLGESANIQIDENAVRIEIVKSLFERTCQETDNQPKTHKQIGCLLSSAIACALTKVTGQPVIIKNETRNPQTRITQITYLYRNKGNS
jgi:hypothetical protein